jgi:hypothetical protein
MKLEKSLVAYCGLYCPKCYRNTVSEAALSLRREMLSASLKDTCGKNPSLRESDTFRKAIDELIALKCPRPCKVGGWDPQCRIRECCVTNGRAGCWECSGFERCKHLKEQFVRNIRKIKESGIDNFIKENSR